MQLDKTLVVIRGRSFSEIGDLTLMVVRRFPQALLVGFTLGALPWILLNALLLSWLPLQEAQVEVLDEETIADRYRYIWLMCVLVFLQAPLAGVFTTYYIGQAVFLERPPWSSVFRNTAGIGGRLVWYLGVVRGAIPAMLLVWLYGGDSFTPEIEVGILLLIVMWAAALRGFRSFLPEIMILERCPVRVSDASAITVGRRSALLHNPISGELMGRFVLTACVACLLAGGLFYASTWLMGQLLNTYRWSLLNTLVLLPLSLWITAAMTTVLRFLSYLDARIKLEGWEVELMLRAEAQRQFSRSIWEPAGGGPQSDRTSARRAVGAAEASASASEAAATSAGASPSAEPVEERLR
jgi:hypothetical protein